MDRKEQRKIFAQLKKKKEEELQLRTVSKYPEIHQKFLDKEITLKQAYNHCMSELLNVEGYKSKGTKGFITNTKIPTSEETPKSESADSHSENSKIPFTQHPIKSNLNLNITFHEINKMDYEQFRDYAYSLRDELLRCWEEEGNPPQIGKNENGIIDDLQNLKNIDTSSLILESNDKDYEFVLSNYNRAGSSCNQFFPSLYDVGVDKSSIKDVLKSEGYRLRWLRVMVRNLKQDYLYQFSSKISDKKNLPSSENDGLIIQRVKEPSDISFTKEELLKLKDKGVLKEYHIKNIEREFNFYKNFEIRVYEKDKKVLIPLIHITRLSFGNRPVNFPPVIAKTIYEHFLPKNKKNIVYDCCSGFGGRFLGSIMSDRNIHYIGNDVNSNLFNDDSYNQLANFVKSHLGINPSFHIEKRSSEEMDKSDELKKYIGSVDLFLTSPPYFSKEKYSSDENQSYLKYPNYKDWIEVYMRKTFEIVHHSLKPNGLCLLNISDINLNDKYFPLELDSIGLLEGIGFKYKYQIGMLMNRYIGLSYEGVLNKWWDKESNCFRKVEPILVFEKV